MKLELKYLAPYLPYELKGMYTDGRSGIYTLTSINILHNNIWTPDFFGDATGVDLKPILRPLSDLDNEILIESASDFKFIPCEVFENHVENWCDAYDEWWNYQYPNFLEMMDSCPRIIFEKLLEWHFDVFGLIDKGLAIDINELKESRS